MTRITQKEKIIFKDEEDPYNPDNFLEGEIHRANYGELIIRYVNGVYCPQTIACTPKMHYPFDKNGKFHFPNDIRCVESFEKYDGTNILQYTYNDANNKTYVSYKTRLTMFPNEDFQILLNKALKKYSTDKIKKNPFENNCNMSYELVGYLNPITIVYDYDIDLRLLFGIKKNGNIVAPTYLTTCVPRAERNYWFESEETLVDLETYYNDTRERLETFLVQLNDNMYKGSEGNMWYCHLDHYTQLYKLKPPTIERIHWAACGSTRMAKIAIRNTLINALEDLSKLTYDDILPYLLEEYTIEEVNIYKEFIEKQIIELNTNREWEKKIVKYYRENSLNINSDKRTCMRSLANNFGREYSTKIWHIMEKYFLQEK